MSHDEYQLKRFIQLIKKYKTYVRDGDLCIFGNRKCAVNMSDELLKYYYAT